MEKYIVRPQFSVGIDKQGSVRVSDTEKFGNPEESYGAVLAACHLELSALSFLALPANRVACSSYQVVTSLLPLQFLENNERKDASNRVANYFDDTMEKVGLVNSQHVVDPQTGVRVRSYSLTDEGVRLQGVGFYLVKSLMDLNTQEGTQVALPIVLSKSARVGSGRKGSEGNWATVLSPYYRAQLLLRLRALPSGETINIERLARDVKLKKQGSISLLSDLESAGIIEHKRVDSEKRGEFNYQPVEKVAWTDDVCLTVDHVPQEAAEIILDELKMNFVNKSEVNTQALTSKLYEFYVTKRQLTNGRIANETTFANYVGLTIMAVVNKGLFSGEFIPRKRQAQIKLTPLGRKVAEILNEVRNACYYHRVAADMSQDYRDEFHQFVNMNAEQLIMLHSREGKKMGTKDQRVRQIVVLLLEGDTCGVRRRDIDKALGISTSNLLNELIQKNILQRNNEESYALRTGRASKGKATYYKITPQARAVLEDNPGVRYEDLLRHLEASDVYHSF